MPKNKTAGNVYIKSLPGGTKVWEYDQVTIVCVICIQKIDYSESNYSFRIEKHCNTAKHQKQLQLSTKSQQLLPKCISSDTPNLFFADLTIAFISANIPFWKLENGSFRNFLEKWTKQATPHRTTIQKGYVENIYKHGRVPSTPKTLSYDKKFEYVLCHLLVLHCCKKMRPINVQYILIN